MGKNFQDVNPFAVLLERVLRESPDVLETPKGVMLSYTAKEAMDAFVVAGDGLWAANDFHPMITDSVVEAYKGDPATAKRRLNEPGFACYVNEVFTPTDATLVIPRLQALAYGRPVTHACSGRCWDVNGKLYVSFWQTRRYVKMCKLVLDKYFAKYSDVFVEVWQDDDLEEMQLHTPSGQNSVCIPASQYWTGKTMTYVDVEHRRLRPE